MGNGNSNTFWNDQCVPNLGPLRNYVRDYIHTDLTQKLHNFVDDHGHWDVAALSQVLIPAVILHVISVRPPGRSDKPDVLVWRWNPELNFTTKSAYTFLMEGNWNEKSSIWKAIWSITAPQRVRMFAWLTYKENIMTNYERERRILTNNHSCPTCGAATETVIYVLRDCPPSRHLWMRIVPQSACSNFFGTDLHSWITQNINMQRPLRDDSIIHRSYSWAKCYEINIKTPVERPRQQVAASTWVLQKNIGTPSALHAELWSIYEGLLIVWSFGVSRLLIQSDCSRAVKLVEDSAAIDSHIPLLRTILKQRWSRCWITKVQ
ncbi:hypothetical protein F3Y22_tig00110243pilonHSYRG00050 [Hibiscus syriacus]|uniref:Reverse transcriptase zinc-binding domain-containing protein n=1 Tax=Hibiscus syriacus TaxID=106335 RepID=A0A6A3BBW2_HIBSY|nr:hypothetical protein F3Y22_tig00110243pilonHSYRG00050 [Hibiscus syriacus]